MSYANKQTSAGRKVNIDGRGHWVDCMDAQTACQNIIGGMMSSKMGKPYRVSSCDLAGYGLMHDRSPLNKSYPPSQTPIATTIGLSQPVG